ncbi:hypothetical protein TNCV_332971 [Trichonephila clavipes]|nr:hypothetical protein TNCV_332971 [Trichonephila clavipes]
MKNTFGVGQGSFIYLILASTSEEDFRLDEYLEYPMLHGYNLVFSDIQIQVLWHSTALRPRVTNHHAVCTFHALILKVEIGGVTIYRPFVLSPVWCSRLRTTISVLLAPCHDGFRGPPSDYVRQVALETTTTAQKFGLAIHQNDQQARRKFVEWAQNEVAVVPDFPKRILFSDEAHFWLNGYINKQKCRIWSEANPQVYVETPLHPEKLTVWCALWAGGIIGPYFFKNDEGHNVTVNGDRYRAMITNFFHS